MEPLANDTQVAQVGERTRRGISWNLMGAVATNAMRIVVIAVLGRTLSASDFGIVAAAISVNVILYSIRDIGVGQALIQRKDLALSHVATSFAVSTYLGVAIAALLAATAPWIGQLYGIPASVDVLRVLGLLFIVRGIAATSRMLCQRDMQFRAIAIIDALSFAVGSIVSMGAAVAGAGPWALVAGYLVEEALSAALYLYVRRPVVSLRIAHAPLRDLMSFGAGQTLAQIAGILAIHGDNFIIGNALGARALGLYTRAYDLVKFPSTVFASIVGSVLFPAFSKLQDERERIATALRRSLFVNALVLLPASALLVVLAPESIHLLMGEGWDDAVLPFQILAATMLLRTTQKLGGLVATAAGAVNGVALAYALYMVLVIGGAKFAVRWGIAGVAISTSLAILVVAFHCSYLAMRVSTLTIHGYAGAHGPGLLLAAVTGAVAWPIAVMLRARGIADCLTFVTVASAALLACLATARLYTRTANSDFVWMRDELRRLRMRVRRRS